MPQKLITLSAQNCNLISSAIELAGSNYAKLPALAAQQRLLSDIISNRYFCNNQHFLAIFRHLYRNIVRNNKKIRPFSLYISALPSSLFHIKYFSIRTRAQYCEYRFIDFIYRLIPPIML